MTRFARSLLRCVVRPATVARRAPPGGRPSRLTRSEALTGAAARTRDSTPRVAPAATPPWPVGRRPRPRVARARPPRNRPPAPSLPLPPPPPPPSHQVRADFRDDVPRVTYVTGDGRGVEGACGYYGGYSGKNLIPSKKCHFPGTVSAGNQRRIEHAARRSLNRNPASATDGNSVAYAVYVRRSRGPRPPRSRSPTVTNWRSPKRSVQCRDAHIRIRLYIYGTERYPARTFVAHVPGRDRSSPTSGVRARRRASVSSKSPGSGRARM